MSNLNKNIILIYFLLILICLIQLRKGSPSEYENIVSSFKQEDKISNKSKEEIISQPITPIVYGKFWCDPSFKLNSVREDVMTNHNFNMIMYRHKYFLLYVSATWCDYCCQQEKELLGVKQMLTEKTFEGEEIPIVQINSDTDLEALKELKIGFFKVPSLYFVKNKEFIQYNSFWKAENIFRFINNLLNPVVELHAITDVEKFFDTSRNFEETNDFLGNTRLNIPEETDHHLRNRLIGFFSEHTEEYSEEYSLFLSLAEKISHRADLRIGLVTDKEIVRHFKQIYDGTWFNSHSWNSIVLKRIDKYYFLDLSLLNDKLEVFMVYNTVSYVDELSNNNNFITSKIATPLALFFIDSTFIVPNFHAHLKFLIDISKKYVGKYVFLFVDGNARTKSKEELGFKKESKLPTLVINYVQSKKQKHFSSASPYTDQELIRFLDQNYLSKLTGSDLDELKEKQIKSYDDKIVRNLKFSTKIEMKNFEKIVSNKKYDVVVFVIDTDYDQASLNLSKYIYKVSEKFKFFGIKSVLITFFDVNENGPWIYQGNAYERGDIWMYPSVSKNSLKFKENMSLLRLMKWIEKNCQLKIRLPSLPHIDIPNHEDYYKRKSILESYEENYNKSELEIDDMIKMDFDDLKEVKTDL